MDIEVGLIRSFWIVRESPVRLPVRRFAVAAYLPSSPKTQVFGKLMNSDEEITQLLDKAGITQQPNGQFFVLSKEQMDVLGIDPLKLA